MKVWLRDYDAQYLLRVNQGWAQYYCNNIVANNKLFLLLSVQNKFKIFFYCSQMKQNNW